MSFPCVEVNGAVNAIVLLMLLIAIILLLPGTTRDEHGISKSHHAINNVRNYP